MPPGTCAFCLQEVDDAPRLCGGCKRRRYCSAACAKRDWRAAGPAEGQGHKAWCSSLAGEEGRDWEVAAVPGKGAGVVALAPLAAGSRVMVDRAYPRSLLEFAEASRGAQALERLMPADASLDDKFDLNMLSCGENGEGGLALRLSRANHSCSANCMHFYDASTRCKVLVAVSDIAAGEEICIAYTLFDDPTKTRDSEACRWILQTKYGVLCPADCICKDEHRNALIAEARDLDRLIIERGGRGDAAGALRAARRMLQLCDEIGGSNRGPAKIRALYDAFQVAVMRGSTVKEARSYAQEAARLARATYSPGSAEVLKYEGLAANPSSHRNFRVVS